MQKQKGVSEGRLQEKKENREERREINEKRNEIPRQSKVQVGKLDGEVKRERKKSWKEG